jgi:hypothetical protein
MKTRIFLIVVGILALHVPACLPIDEDVDPDDPVAKFLGVWKVNETCSRMNYNVEILQDPGNSAQVLIYNFGNPGTGYDPAVGLVVSNTINVFAQTIGEGWTVNGTGTYQSGGNISWNYTLIIQPNEFTCSATYSP